MNNFLICMFDFKLVGRGVLRDQFLENPILGFDYDCVHYEPEKSISFKLLNSEQIELTSHETQNIESFIENFPFKVWEIGEDGLCKGEKTLPEVTGKYAHCPPPKIEGHYWYNPKKNQWDYIYGVDENKKYIGNVPFVESKFFADRPANFAFEIWDDEKQEWIDPRTLDQFKQDIIDDIKSISKNVKKYGVILGGNVWGSSEEDLKAIDAAPQNSASWKTIDGEDVVLSNFNLIDIKNAILEYRSAVDERLNIAISKIQSSATREEVQKVEF